MTSKESLLGIGTSTTHRNLQQALDAIPATHIISSIQNIITKDIEIHNIEEYRRTLLF